MEKKPHWSFWEYVNHDQVTKSVKSQKTNCKKITKKGKKTLSALHIEWILLVLSEVVDRRGF